MTIAEKLRTEGIEHGIREDVQEILQERFGEVPQNIVYKLSRVHDVGMLRRMHRLALRTESTDEFCQRLEENRES